MLLTAENSLHPAGLSILDLKTGVKPKIIIRLILMLSQLEKADVCSGLMAVIKLQVDRIGQTEYLNMMDLKILKFLSLD